MADGRPFGFAAVLFDTHALISQTAEKRRVVSI